MALSAPRNSRAFIRRPKPEQTLEINFGFIWAILSTALIVCVIFSAVSVVYSPMHEILPDGQQVTLSEAEGTTSTHTHDSVEGGAPALAYARNQAGGGNGRYVEVQNRHESAEERRQRIADDLEMLNDIRKGYLGSVWAKNMDKEELVQDTNTPTEGTLNNAKTGQDESPSAGMYERTLEFTTCGSITETMLSIAYGVTLAVQHNRTIVLPVMHSFKKIIGDNAAAGGADGSVPQSERLEFSDIFDEELFVSALMDGWGLKVIRQPSQSLTITEVLHEKMSPSTVYEQLLTITDAPRVRLQGCALYSMSASDVSVFSSIFLATVSSLKPCQFLAKIVLSGCNMVAKISSMKVFNGLEVLTHKTWGAPDGDKESECAQLVGESYDNQISLDHSGAGAESGVKPPLTREKAIETLCKDADAKPARIVDLLKDRGVPGGRPIYLHTSTPAHARTAHALRAVFRNIQTRDDIEKYAGTIDTLSREQQELIDFFICKASTVFLGHSVSPFTAVLAMLRLPKNDYTFWYNSGTIPLLHRIPVLQGVPLIIPYDREQNQEEQLKVSITSAIDIGKASVTCVYTAAGGPTRTSLNANPDATSDPLVVWMREQGVRVLMPEPSTLKYIENKWIGLIVPRMRIHHEYVVVGRVESVYSSPLTLDWAVPIDTAAKALQLPQCDDSVETVENNNMDNEYASAIMYHMPRILRTATRVDAGVKERLKDIPVQDRAKTGYAFALDFYTNIE